MQWAHQVADRFPDGQPHVNLRGFDLRAEPLDPLAVVRDFLVGLGLPANALPESDEALVAEYRSLLVQQQVGERERAIELCWEAEASFESDAGSTAIPHANNAETLGDIYVELGRYAEAVDSYRLFVDRLRANHNIYYLGEGLVRLARAQIAAGETGAARENLAEAVSIYEKLWHRETDEARELLTSVTNV